MTIIKQIGKQTKLDQTKLEGVAFEHWKHYATHGIYEDYPRIDSQKTDRKCVADAFYNLNTIIEKHNLDITSNSVIQLIEGKKLPEVLTKQDKSFLASLDEKAKADLASVAKDLYGFCLKIQEIELSKGRAA